MNVDKKNVGSESQSTIPHPKVNIHRQSSLLDFVKSTVKANDLGQTEKSQTKIEKRHVFQQTPQPRQNTTTPSDDIKQSNIGKRNFQTQSRCTNIFQIQDKENANIINRTAILPRNLNNDGGALLGSSLWNEDNTQKQLAGFQRFYPRKQNSKSLSPNTMQFQRFHSTKSNQGQPTSVLDKNQPLNSKNPWYQLELIATHSKSKSASKLPYNQQGFITPIRSQILNHPILGEQTPMNTKTAGQISQLKRISAKKNDLNSLDVSNILAENKKRCPNKCVSQENQIVGLPKKQRDPKLNRQINKRQFQTPSQISPVKHILLENKLISDQYTNQSNISQDIEANDQTQQRDELQNTNKIASQMMIPQSASNSKTQTSQSQNLKLSAGLKYLSMKVIELVIKKKKITQCEVASQLIHILKQSGNAGLFQSPIISEPCPQDEELTSEQEDKGYGNSQEMCTFNDKGEKNIGRRVYDALNVLFAAGVLDKNGKYFEPNYDSPEFQRIKSDILEKQKHSEMTKSSFLRNMNQQFFTSSQIQEKHQNILQLQQQILLKKQKTQCLQENNECKWKELTNSFRTLICYQKLLDSNKKRDHKHATKFKFPFIVYQTKDDKQHIELLYKDALKQQLSIFSEHQFNILGDIDLFMNTDSSNPDSPRQGDKSSTDDPKIYQLESIEQMKKLVVSNIHPDDLKVATTNKLKQSKTLVKIYRKLPQNEKLKIVPYQEQLKQTQEIDQMDSMQ